MSVPLPPITEDQESSSTPPSLHHSTLAPLPLPLPLPLSQGRQAFEEAKALYESGLYIARDNPQAAIAHFLQAASVFEELKGQKKKREKCFWQAAVSFGRVGWTAKKRRDWNEAKMAFEEALNLFRMIGDSEKEATTLYQLSLVSFDLLAASDYLKKAALIYTKLGDDEKEAMCLAELANLFGGRRNQRDVESSLFHWRQALLLYMKIGDQGKEGRALYSIGEVLLHTDKEAAYNHFLQARVVFRRLGNQPKQDGNCSYQLGKICTGKKSFQAAVQFFEESSALFRQIEAKTDEAWSLYRLALVMLKVDSNDLAVDYLTEARRLFAEVGNERQAEGSCLMRIGEILKDSNPPLAKTLVEEALEYVDPVKERIGRRSTLVLQHLQGSSPFKRSTRYTYMRDIAEDDEEEVNQSGEQWSFAGATEEGGTRGIDEERTRGGRDGSEGGEGAWWAMSTFRTRSTRSNRIKQEDQGDANSARASPTPPQPRTSLLDLSDEIISLVFDQAYRPPSTSPFGVIRLQSIDFLINKRIFELARPLWSKALLIKESQLDSRLAGIHLHKKRRDHLRMLEVPVTNHLYNLLNSVFPRLPLLTHLALQITESASAVSTSTLAEGLIKLVNLEKLRLRSPRHLTPLHDFYHLYLSHKPVKIPHVSLEIGGTPRVTQGLEEGFRCDSYRWTLDLPSTFFRFDWSSLRSLDLRGWAGYLPWADTVLGGIRLAITGNAQSNGRISNIQKIPLRRLSLYLRLPPMPNFPQFGFFSMTDFQKLFELLAFTDLVQLELHGLDLIPVPPAHAKLRTVTILKLSGTCSFRETNHFQALLVFLTAFPSLTRLHLAGSSFFGLSSTANEMSRLETMPLFFRFPELSTLLVYLQQSSVITFTYRGEGEQREMRWTRSSAGEEFDQDCWTL